MSLFVNESEMHQWLRKELEDCSGLADLITNTEYIDDYKPSSLEEHRVLDSFNTCLSALYITDVISDNENISLHNTGSLKPDFLLYSAESEGIVVVELKNLSGPTRQAGTELGAYSCEIRTYLPFLSDGDLFSVVISTSWPTLLRHYIFHEIFWQNKNIICLQPVKLNDSIKLEIKKIPELLEADTATRISDKHITGYQLCLYDYGLYKENPDKNRLDKYIPQMKAALSIMSTEGNRQNGHGFAFLWRDLWERSLAPYSISIFNFGPFQSIERFFHNSESLVDITEMQKRFINLIQEQDPSGHGNSLSKITSSGERFLKNICEPRPEGFTNWLALKEIMLSRAQLLGFQGWGLFGHLFNERLIEEYSSGNINVSNTDPGIGLQVVNDLVDPDYEFIDLSHIEIDWDSTKD
ncbi:MAG: hypothetical protein KKD92_07605 [Proteobacteria bacterium]|nr:hypothetical protein [Pseudomonadota bacterium]